MTNLIDRSQTRFKTARFFSSWALLLSYIPIIILYILWAYHDYPNVSSASNLARARTSRQQSDDHPNERHTLYQIEIVNNPMIDNASLVISYQQQSDDKSRLNQYEE